MIVHIVKYHFDPNFTLECAFLVGCCGPGLRLILKKKEPDVGHRAVIPATWEGWGGSWLEASWTKKVNETPSQPLSWR
jgi:hypothetical protein